MENNPSSVTPFSTHINIDPNTGWDWITLRYDDENPNLGKEIGIIPKAGSNMCSFKFGDKELLSQHPSRNDKLIKQYCIVMEAGKNYIESLDEAGKILQRMSGGKEEPEPKHEYNIFEERLPVL